VHEKNVEGRLRARGADKAGYSRSEVRRTREFRKAKSAWQVLSFWADVLVNCASHGVRVVFADMHMDTGGVQPCWNIVGEGGGG